MRNTVVCLDFIAILLCSSLFTNAEETRTWKDESGLFSIEASLETIDGDSVKLKRADNGTVINMPIARLSEADRQFIAGLAAQNPFEGGTGVPVAVSKQQPVASVSTFTADLEVQAVDISKARQAGGVMPGVWNCEPDPTPQREYPTNVVRLNFRMDNVSASATTNFFVSPTGKTAVRAMNVAAPVDMAQNRAASEARSAALRAAHEQRVNAMRSGNAPPTIPTPEPIDDGRKGRTRIFVADTVTGEIITHDTLLKLVPFGFSPNGKRLLVHQETWSFPATGKQTLLHIAEESAGWDAVATFEPFAQLKSANNSSTSTDADVQFATWVDDEHILVRSKTGTLILLNIDTGTAIWRMKIEPSGGIELSPGGKYCFLPVGDMTILYETMTGTPIGGADIARAQFRFSPDGKRFVTSNAQGIILGDATAGAIDAPFFVSGNSNLQHVFWLDNRYLFTNGTVIDTTSKGVVWNYLGLGHNIKLAGGYAWCLFSKAREGSYLAPLTIPHAGMILPGIVEDSDAALVLKSGAAVSLVLDDSIVKERKEIRESIEKKVADNGWVLADTAPVTITLSMKEEKADTTEYGVSRGLPVPRPRIRSPLDGPGIEVKFQPERFDLNIAEKEGKEIWSSTHTTKPPSQLPLNVIQEDSLQEVVDKAMEANSYKEWLDKVFIPKTISRPQDGKGESRVTENGIVDVGSGMR